MLADNDSHSLPLLVIHLLQAQPAQMANDFRVVLT